MLEKGRLQKKPLTCALSVARHPQMVGISKRPYRISNVFYLYIGEFRGTQAAFDFLFQTLFALTFRVIVIFFFTFNRKLARKLQLYIAFECAIFTQCKV